MRVLLINAFAVSSDGGRQRYGEFRHHLQLALKEIERQDVTPVELIEKSRQEVDEFLFEMHSSFVDPHNITNFDRLDFVFAVGDASTSPWAPAMRKLTLLVKMCMMTGKCFYGSGLGAGLLAFLCSTAGENLRVINNAGKGSLVNDIQLVPPPRSPDPASCVGRSDSKATEVLLDTGSGDFFSFNRITKLWIPHGNTGLMNHNSDHAHGYGAKINSARAGTKTHRSQLSHALYTSKRGDTRCCSRLDATNHPLLALLPREFLVNCKSTWDLDEPINATGNNKYRVLLDSSRGPVFVEFGNCVGSHFSLSREYPESCKLLRNFVVSKYEFFRVHEHIDRSYVSAITGSARLKDRLQLATTKTTGAAAATSSRDHAGKLATGAVTMTSGKTSPKRCRPVSAGPFRTTTKQSEDQQMIRTSRSEYPTPRANADVLSSARQCREMPTADSNNQREVTPRSSRPQTARASLGRAKHEIHPEVESPDMDEPTEFVSPRSATLSIKAHRRIRVAQQNEREKPYCAFDKFNALHAAEKDQYYSVVNDAPYMSQAEREQLEHQQDKLKWVAGPFRTAVGKASTQVAPEVSIFARAPFEERNLPDFIIQRRQLELPSPPTRMPAQPARGKPRPASAASTRVRTHR